MLDYQYKKQYVKCPLTLFEAVHVCKGFF
uniref:Uncharacterized protein n=1 Tax=Anguilla anguilla TaxID=7936 RepID=A0A0E9RCI7_ANGAN